MDINKISNFAISSLIVMGMTACSSEDNTDNGGGMEINTQASSIGVVLNSTDRVTNYNALTSGAKAFTRALPASGVPSLGLKLPTKPTGDDDDYTPYQGDKELTGNSVYQSNFSANPGTLNMNGHSLLLKHNLTLNGLTGGGTIYVSGNVTLTLDGVSSTGTSIVVYKGGKLKLDNTTAFTVEKGASLMAQTTFYKSGDGNKEVAKDQTFLGIDLTNNGNILTTNELHAKTITLGADSKTQVGSNVTADEKLTAAGKLSAQIITAKDASVTGTVVASKLFSLANSLTVNGAEAKVYGNYIKAGQYDDTKNKAATFIRQENGSNIYVGDNGLINTYTYYNTDGKGSKLNLTDGKLAVLETKQIVTGSDDATFINTADGGLFGVYFKRAYKGSVTADNLLDWDDFAFVGGNVRKLNKENDFADITIPADKDIQCDGFNPNAEGTKTATDYQVLRVAAAVTYGVNDGERKGRSATGVVVDGNNVYVCYHTNGTAQAGMLDYLTTDNNGHVTLRQSVSAVDESKKNVIDWNNIALDKEQHKLIGVGNGVKGGVITSLALKADGAFDTDATSTTGNKSLEPLKYTILQKVAGGDNTGDGKHNTGDGNAVIVNGQFYQVATLYGTEIFNRSDLSGTYVNKLGRAKYIAADSKNVYVSYLDNNALKVNTYGATNYRLENVTNTWNVGTLDPVKGKSVLAVDGNDIYVCRGANGLAKYTNGTLTGLFIPKDATYTADAENTKYPEGTTVTRGYCNGVCVKGDKIYIAYGSLGLIVINKKDMTATTEDAAKQTPEVARYTAGKSANFVAVDGNDNIFVAYGQNHLMVLKLEARKL
ncbi:MAG: hypothetical protein PUD23_05025 [Prevotella sp.]|nr:hypothetical protein [Prevotella sp.]